MTKLKEAIQAAGLKQFRVAQLAGVSETEFSRMTTGRQRVPANIRHKIGKILGKPIDEIFPEYLSKEAGGRDL